MPIPQGNRWRASMILILEFSKQDRQDAYPQEKVEGECLAHPISLEGK